MKSISFDQLKTMLKSMSNAIFKRLGNVSNRVDAVEKKVNTFKQPKTIIIERDSALNNGTATSDTPFDEAWAMSDAELTASIVVTTKSYNHVYISSSIASVEHINVLDQKMLRIITNDYYDGSKGERHHNEINWCKINGINVFDRKAFITVERYSIAELMNKTNSFTLAQNGYLDLATMSESTKGGAKVGEGLEVVEGALRVKPEGEYELIETITLGYEEIKEKPEDWETNKTSYFWMQDKTIAPVTTQDWNSRDRFFKEIEYDEVNTIVRNIMPDGTPYDFKKIFLRVYTPPDTETESSTSINYSFGNNGVMTVAHINKNGCYGSVCAWIECGMLMLLSGHTISKWGNMETKLPAHYRWMHAAKTINEVEIAVPGSPAINLKRGSIFEIWGVRAQ